jgi:hypothetical protein
MDATLKDMRFGNGKANQAQNSRLESFWGSLFYGHDQENGHAHDGI